MEGDQSSASPSTPPPPIAAPISAPVAATLTLDDDLRRAFLADRDVPCPRCGYNLRTLKGDRCTECGTPIVLSVQAGEPVLRAWAFTIVMAGLGAGIGLLFLSLTLGEAGPPPLRYWWVVLPSWAYFPIVPALLIYRRRFVRMPSGWQWGVGAFLGVVVLAVMYGLLHLR